MTSPWPSSRQRRLRWRKYLLVGTSAAISRVVDGEPSRREDHLFFGENEAKQNANFPHSTRFDFEEPFARRFAPLKAASLDGDAGITDIEAPRIMEWICVADGESNINTQRGDAHGVA
jgi:hypothetical protein